MLIISGAQGVGKTTLIDLLLAVRPFLKLSISSTTRAKRTGEKNGEYNFLTEEDFSHREKRGDFMEVVRVHGYRYGTEKIYFSNYSVLNVTASSIENFKALVGGGQYYVSIFIDAPIEVIRERIYRRQDGDVEKKIAFSLKEIEYKKYFDHIIYNDGSVEEALDKLLKIVDTYLQYID